MNPVSTCLLKIASALAEFAAELEDDLEPKPGPIEPPPPVDPEPTPDPEPEPTPDPIPDPTPDPEPAPTPDPVSRFEKAIVFSDDGPIKLTKSLVDVHPLTANVYGEECGFIATLNLQEPPPDGGFIAIASVWGENMQWRLAVESRTSIRLTGYVSDNHYAACTAIVDDMVGRETHIAWGIEIDSSNGQYILHLWVDGVVRDVAKLPEALGEKVGVDSPLSFNSDESGFVRGVYTLSDIRYAIGATPDQSDVDRYSAPPHPDGLYIMRTGDTFAAAAFGKGFADLPHTTPFMWIDGENVPLQRIRNNPPRELAFSGQTPRSVGNGESTIRVEWRWTGAPAPDAEQEWEGAIETKPIGWAALPKNAEGMPHLRRDGSFGTEIRPDSRLLVGVYGFGAGNFANDRYGDKTRVEMENAGIAIEDGSILHYEPKPGGWKQWLEMTEQMRIANATHLAKWNGDYIVPNDDAMGPDSLAALMQLDQWPDYFAGWVQSMEQLTGKKAIATILKDEVNLAFGSNPNDASQLLLSKFARYGGAAAFVAAMRRAYRAPVSFGMFGVNNDVPVGYSDWMKPEFSDLICQYHQPNNLPAPWTGQNLRQTSETLRWAAKHRDVTRPFSLNFGLIVDYFIMQENGEWKKTIAATDPESIPAQIWVDIAFGATVCRGYALAAFDLVQVDLPRFSSLRGVPATRNAALRSVDVPPPPVFRGSLMFMNRFNRRVAGAGVAAPGSEYQKAVAPGDLVYYAMLGSATMVKDYQKLLLGAEQPTEDAGPDFIVAHRNGPYGRIFFVVNLSEQPRVFPDDKIPPAFWTTTEMMDSGGNRAPHAFNTPIAPNGVLVLAAE